MAAALTITADMTIDALKLMRLQSWLSPAFPIGAYSYSHGLERAVESDAVRDRATLVDWLDADLRHGSGRADAIFLAEAWRAASASSLSPGHCVSAPSPGGFAATLSRDGIGLEYAAGSKPFFRNQKKGELDQGALRNERPLPSRERAGTQCLGEGAGSATETDHCDILAVAELAAAMRGTAELALESGQQGVAFLTAVRKAWPDERLDSVAAALKHAGTTPVLPVAAGMACAVHAIALELAVPLYVQAAVANLVNAAVRLIPLGQSDGQKTVAALEEAVLDTAEDALSAGLCDGGSAAFMIDIASMQHETQYTRLFRS